MKLHFIPILLSLFLTSCGEKNKNEEEIEQIPVDIKVERFDKAFFEAKPQDLAKVKKDYPLFFPVETEDAVWLEKIQNPLWRELYQEVQKEYGDFAPVQASFEDLLKHIKFYFPKTKTPKLVTVISEMDYNNKVIYRDSLIVLSLEMYLGKDHRFYTFPAYIKQNFERNQIMPDAVSAFFKYSVRPNSEKNLLARMIFEGKELYLKDVLIPESIDADKIGYTPEQLLWCQENELYMWEYFMQKQLLFNDDNKLMARFINPAPFSKFYLEIDNESPGRVGAWVGWQIVRSYMENNQVTVPELMQKGAKEIFEKSKYKPKK